MIKNKHVLHALEGVYRRFNFGREEFFSDRCQVNLSQLLPQIS